MRASGPLIMLLALLGLTGCGSALRSLPPPGLEQAHRIRVFTDGFHSGLVIERKVLPRELDPPLNEPAQQATLKSLHFGEEEWTTGRDMSWPHACRLAIIPGNGVIQSDPTKSDLSGIPGLDRARIRTWDLRLSQRAMDALIDRLEHYWVAQPVAMIEVDGIAPATLYAAAHDWSAFDNCHDFTIDLLRAAGLDIRGRMIWLAGGFTVDLDEATDQVQAAGIQVIGPAPAQ